jgi:hypothetical protein
VAALGVVLDLGVRLEAEPLGDGAVLARLLGKLLLDDERLLRGLGLAWWPQ